MFKISNLHVILLRCLSKSQFQKGGMLCGGYAAGLDQPARIRAGGGPQGGSSGKKTVPKL